MTHNKVLAKGIGSTPMLGTKKLIINFKIKYYEKEL